MTILGIDPGKSGAVAVLDEGGELLKVHDTPSTLVARFKDFERI
jgi:predicted RNase H-like nuclease (RuvC/YqgF family)